MADRVPIEVGKSVLNITGPEVMRALDISKLKELLLEDGSNGKTEILGHSKPHIINVEPSSKLAGEKIKALGVLVFGPDAHVSHPFVAGPSKHAALDDICMKQVEIVGPPSIKFASLLHLFYSATFIDAADKCSAEYPQKAELVQKFRRCAAAFCEADSSHDAMELKEAICPQDHFVFESMSCGTAPDGELHGNLHESFATQVLRAAIVRELGSNIQLATSLAGIGDKYLLYRNNLGTLLGVNAEGEGQNYFGRVWMDVLIPLYQGLQEEKSAPSKKKVFGEPPANSSLVAKILALRKDTPQLEASDENGESNDDEDGVRSGQSKPPRKEQKRRHAKVSGNASQDDNKGRESEESDADEVVYQGWSWGGDPDEGTDEWKGDDDGTDDDKQPSKRCKKPYNPLEDSEFETEEFKAFEARLEAAGAFGEAHPAVQANDYWMC